MFVMFIRSTLRRKTKRAGMPSLRLSFVYVLYLPAPSTSGSLAAKLPEDIIYFSFATDGSKAFLGVLPSFFAAKATSSIYIFCALANTSAAWSIPNLVAYFAAADSPFWV